MDKRRADALVAALSEAKQKGVSQRAVAEAAGVKETLLSMYKAGTLPNVIVGQKIAAVLGSTVEDVWPLKDFGDGGTDAGTG